MKKMKKIPCADREPTDARSKHTRPRYRLAADVLFSQSGSVSAAVGSYKAIVALTEHRRLAGKVKTPDGETSPEA